MIFVGLGTVHLACVVNHAHSLDICVANWRIYESSTHLMDNNVPLYNLGTTPNDRGVRYPVLLASLRKMFLMLVRSFL
ncbi:hypothetical protein IW261DRAFT_172324 [Armillaria novae-zelandiae]|uniref:Secreted protein n=1 Tax=Armillaria novae-zelandiae TaxID=153914 RepID=A0AA39TY11_9AGAR|nr:hypothetical protein IW261DRAFT_172324 [Armillaria novae-zelandiae]